MSADAPTVDEMAMAHLRLSQSLRSLSVSHASYKATEQTLVELAEATAALLTNRGRTGRSA